jgi:glucan phosphoethanolaminetransferase (alkaline phosphatase superfamily)
MIKPLFKQKLPFLLFVTICTLFIGIAFIIVEFADNPFYGFMGFIITGIHFSIVLLATFFLIWLIAINKYCFAVFFPFFSIIGSILAYFRYSYKATITPMILEATFNNDIRTSLDLISLPLILYILICLTFSIILIKIRFNITSIRKPILQFFIALSLFLITQNGHTTIKQKVYSRFPFSVYYNMKEYYNSKHEISNTRISIGEDAKCKADSLIVVFVIGESLRADHLGLNNYRRNTTPLLSNKKAISFPHIYSEYAVTNLSVPHILTRADSAHTQLAYTEKSFISIFNKCGFYTAWLANQDPSKFFISFIKESDTLAYCHPEKSVYVYSRWLDEDLLPILTKLKKKNNPRKLFVLHTIGSHWYYKNHYSEKFEKFTPTTKSRLIVQCTPEEIINTYDNTVSYTDFFLSKLIDIFTNENAIVIYLSDHGEILGEDGFWLHANDDKAAKNPACIIWFSKKYIEKYTIKTDAALKNSNNHLRTDFLFHSILDAADINSSIINTKLDIFQINSQKQ